MEKECPKCHSRFTNTKIFCPHCNFSVLDENTRIQWGSRWNAMKPLGLGIGLGVFVLVMYFAISVDDPTSMGLSMGLIIFVLLIGIVLFFLPFHLKARCRPLEKYELTHRGIRIQAKEDRLIPWEYFRSPEVLSQKGFVNIKDSTINKKLKFFVFDKAKSDTVEIFLPQDANKASMILHIIKDRLALRPN